MAKQEKPKFPTEVVTLPSKGNFYPEGHPLSSGEVEVKYMTAKEEDILTSQNLIKQGKVIDVLLESLVTTYAFARAASPMKIPSIYGTSLPIMGISNMFWDSPIKNLDFHYNIILVFYCIFLIMCSVLSDILRNIKS